MITPYDQVLKMIDMTLAENEQVTTLEEEAEPEYISPHAGDHDQYTDVAFAKTIDLIRTCPGKMYSFDKTSLNPYESWVDLLALLQDESMMNVWFNGEIPEDEEDADETSIDFERYSIFLEEMIYQLMYDLSLVARGFMGYGGALTHDLKDEISDKISGSGLYKVMSMQLFDNSPEKYPMSSLTATTYEIDRLILVYPHLSPAQQITVQEYMDWAIPKVYPNRLI